MYARMDLTASDFRRDEKSKKQYNLSLKRSKQNIRPTADKSLHGKTERTSPLVQKNYEETVSELGDSQNFMLRLSTSFSMDDEDDQRQAVKSASKAPERKNAEVIVISDSSDDASPDKYLQSCRGASKNVDNRPRSVYLIKSSDSEDGAEKRQGSAGIAAEKLPASGPLRCSILYTSDELESEIESMSFRDKENILKLRDKVPAGKQFFGDFDKQIENTNIIFGNEKNISKPRDELIAPEKIFENVKTSENESTRITNRENVSKFFGNFDKKNSNESTSFTNKKDLSKRRQEVPSSETIFGKVDNPVGKTDRPRGILTENSCNINTPEIQKKISEDTRKTDESRRTPISARSSNRAGLLSRKDTRTILKTLKSTRLVYDSPTSWKKSSHVSDSSDSDDSEVSSRKTKKKENDENIARREAVIIAETDSDSDEKVVEDLSRPSKTHVSRFLDPGVSDETALSEKKKLEIAHWLLTNSLDSRSDSSISNVSASQKNSPTSGNSSLERLEMNYETPNNRGKLRSLKNLKEFETPKNNPKLLRTPEVGVRSIVEPISGARTAKSVKQTTIDSFVKTSKDGTRKILGSNAAVGKRNDLVSPAVKEATEALGLMDCADILDKLYGETWRAKADVLIPSTEPRKNNVPRKDKAVQTERKINPRSKKTGKSSTSSSTVDDFDKFVKDIRPNLNSTKKPVSKTNRRRCSFIQDSSSSSDNGESSYMTALTTPRISDNRKLVNRQTPVSAILQRVKAICDSDSDDDKFRKNQPKNYRKQLSYSDDESSSNTSEYDPSDVIPPKPTTKPSIVSAKVTKAPVYAQQKRIDKSKTFLESLSATIPLTEAHPDAKKYRQNFKNTREDLCKYLYKIYNEKIFDNKLPSDMVIEWNVRMRGTAGFCYNKRSVKALGGVTRSSRIVLATKILDTPDRLRDTLVHEMCHAAAWLINEVSDGHGPFWKGWASKAMKAFPELPPIRRCHDYEIKTKFTYRCVGCGYSVGRHSKSLDVEKKRCGHCYGKFELLINKTTKSGTVEVRTPTTKKPTAFALFVKENYHSVKKERKGVAHKEVMQILGQQFSAIKISKRNGNSDDNNSDVVSKV